MAALAVRSDAGMLVLVANLTRDPVAIDLPFDAATSGLCQVQSLDETTFDAATGDPDGFRAAAQTVSTGALAASTLGAYAVMAITLPAA